MSLKQNHSRMSVRVYMEGQDNRSYIDYEMIDEYCKTNEGRVYTCLIKKKKKTFDTVIHTRHTS